MAKQSSPNNTSTPRPKRMVTVDGVRYSVRNSDRLGSTVAHRLPTSSRQTSTTHRTARIGEKPLPKAVRVPKTQQAIMQADTKRIASSKAQPTGKATSQLPSLRSMESQQRPSLWSGVIGPSFSHGYTKKSVFASLGIVLLSPWTWLYLFVPVLVLAIAEVQNKPLGDLYAQAISLLRNTNPEVVFWVLIGALMVLATIWFWRHLCLMVAYGLVARKIDHRIANAKHLWLQSAGKIWRFVMIAVFDLLLATVMMLTFGLVIKQALTNEAIVAVRSLTFNLAILVGLVLFWLATMHRPITRVMLAITNRSTSFIIVRSFGVIFRNWAYSLALGFFWLIAGSITVSLIAGIGWASVVYGLLQITTTTGRALLLVFTACLMLFILSLFTIWSVSYWPRAYQWLAWRSYPRDVSRMMSDVWHQKSRYRVIGEVGLLIFSVAFIMVMLFFWGRSRFVEFYSHSVSILPESITEIIK